MKDKGILDKSLATKIEWKDGCNPTIKKMKKKSKGKKVNVEVKTDSFFNFFTDIDPENTETKEKPEGDDDEENDEENDELDKLQEELDLGEQFKDDLVPLALEYYLGVIDISDNEEEEYGEEGAPKKDGGDSDEDGSKKKKKKGKKGGMQVGPDGKECKPQ